MISHMTITVVFYLFFLRALWISGSQVFASLIAVLDSVYLFIPFTTHWLVYLSSTVTILCYTSLNKRSD
jgi:hypothetical protein